MIRGGAYAERPLYWITLPVGGSALIDTSWPRRRSHGIGFSVRRWDNSVSLRAENRTSIGSLQPVAATRSVESCVAKTKHRSEQVGYFRNGSIPANPEISANDSLQYLCIAIHSRMERSPGRPATNDLSWVDS